MSFTLAIVEAFSGLIFLIIIIGIVSIIALIKLLKIRHSKLKDIENKPLEERYDIEKDYLFEASILADLVGMTSYLIPVVGEGLDFITAPIISTFLFIIYRKYNKTTRKAIFFRIGKNKTRFFTHLFGPFGYSIEEMFTPFDVIPSATILWFYTFHWAEESNKKAYFENVSHSENHINGSSLPETDWNSSPNELPSMDSPSLKLISENAQKFLDENYKKEKNAHAVAEVIPVQDMAFDYKPKQVESNRQDSITASITNKDAISASKESINNHDMHVSEEMKKMLIVKAKAGDIMALIKLADIYIAKADEKSIDLAIKFLKHAASQKSYLAHAKLGIIYTDVNHDVFNYDLGITHLTIAAKNNVPEALKMLKELNA